MAPKDAFSDSDDEETTETQTSVLLGLPDGTIANPLDLADPAVSRMGGIPAFPRRVAPPPIALAQCKVCNSIMELLVQLWCPFEASPYDRVLYVWGCSRMPCQKKEGSVRACRVLRYNSKYAKKLQRRKEQGAAKAAVTLARTTTQAAPSVNPFAMQLNDSPSLGPFGGQIFGASLFDDTSETTPASADENPSDTDSANDEEDEVEHLATALDSSKLTSDEWSTAPSFIPVYLDTSAEYIPTPRPVKKASSISDAQEGQWGSEGYEKTQGIDNVFEAFLKRVEVEPEQCVRYDLSGVPLAYSKDKTYDLLFPTASPDPGTHTVITKSSFSLTGSESPKRAYNPGIVAPCPHCSGPRAFECQLMPNMLNTLRRHSRAKPKKQSDEERRAELARSLARDQTAAERLEMEWGTCLVFCCLPNCATREGSEARECWREELVHVQWEE